MYRATPSSPTSEEQEQLELDCSLCYVKLLPTATAPTRATEHSAGFDLCSAEDTVVPAGMQKLVKTGLSMRTPPGTYMQLVERSGNRLKHNIGVGAGVIDHDYTGPVGVVLVNHGHEHFNVKIGDRIAQGIVKVIQQPPTRELQALPDTARGTGGFGSTGTRPLEGGLATADASQTS